MLEFGNLMDQVVPVFLHRKAVWDQSALHTLDQAPWMVLQLESLQHRHFFHSIQFCISYAVTACPQSIDP